jgi:hypothetical protein
MGKSISRVVANLLYLPFHLIYIGLYIVAFIPGYGAYCEEGEKIVPYVFLAANSTFIAGILFTLFMRFCGKGQFGFYLEFEEHD